MSRDRLFWWATGTAILTALGMSALVRRFRIGEDAAVGVVYSGMFALGIAIISTVRSFAVDLVHFLFGNVLSVSDTDLLRIAAVSALIVIVVVLFYKEMVLVTFDRVFAASLRLSSRSLTALQYVLMALAIAVALQTIGIALVVTLMVAPAGRGAAGRAPLPSRRAGRGRDRRRLRRGRPVPLLPPERSIGGGGRAGLRPSSL